MKTNKQILKNEGKCEMKYEIKSRLVNAGNSIDRHGNHNRTMRKKYELYVDGKFVNEYYRLRDAKLRFKQIESEEVA